MPIEFSTTIRSQWERDDPTGIAYTYEKLSMLPPSFTTIWIQDHLQKETLAITIWAEFEQVPPTEEPYKLGPTPADAIAQLQPYIALGISHFILLADNETLKHFCAEVVPAFAFA